jgi:uncharacterized UBP type Zn finger protein
MSGETGDLEGSVEWLLEHEDDSDIDEPIPRVPVSQGIPPHHNGNRTIPALSFNNSGVHHTTSPLNLNFQFILIY